MVPALSLPTIWLPLPAGSERTKTVREYLWSLFAEDYILQYGSIQKGDVETVFPFVYGVSYRPDKIGIKLDTMDHLLTVLETPVNLDGTELSWNAAGASPIPL